MKSAMLCVHANERAYAGPCMCPTDCYCKVAGACSIVAKEMQMPPGKIVRVDGDESPIPMLLWCPECGSRHIDAGEFATKVHTTHACQTCGHVWRPAVVATVGVLFLPGFKNES